MTAGRPLVHAGLLLAAGIVLLPLALVLLTSLKSIAEIDKGSLFALPRTPSWDAWRAAWSTACIGQDCRGIAGAVTNSLTIVLPALGLSVALGAVSGFAISRRAGPWWELIPVLLIFCLFVPGQVVLYPMIVLVRALDLYGTIGGAVLVHVVWGLPFVTLVFCNFFAEVPRDVVKAAQVDGAGFWDVFRFVLLPAALPACAAVVVLQFTYLWNEFLLNLTFAPADRQPVMVALNILAGAQYGSDAYNLNMAAALIAALPAMLLYVLAGPLFLRGMAAFRS